MASCELKFCASGAYATPYTIGSHTHPCWELIYYVNGNGAVIVDREKYEFSPDTFSLIAPHATHAEKGCAQTEILYIGFTAPDDLPLQSGLYENKKIEVLPLLRMIEAEMRTAGANGTKLMDLLCSSLAILLARPNQEQKEQDKTAMIEYVKNYLDLNYMNRVRIKDLAKNIGYSYDYFRHVFQQYVGMTAKDYLMQAQLRNAKEQLLQGKSVKEVAASCGYASDAHFCNLFRQMTGQSPAAFVNEKTDTKYPQISFEME